MIIVSIAMVLIAAFVLPDEYIIDILKRLNEIWKKEQIIQRQYEELKSKAPTGEIIRTRPRKPGRPVRNG